MSWRTEADRMWRDPETRREFESETGFAPLAESEDELELQKADGHVDAYHRRFVEWARVRIETREMSLPDQIRHVAETCPPREREALRGIALRFEKEYEPFGGLGCGNPDCETCV